MTPEEARIILAAAQGRREDLPPKKLAEAESLVARDPELRAWKERLERADHAAEEALQQITAPTQVRDRLVKAEADKDRADDTPPTADPHARTAGDASKLIPFPPSGTEDAPEPSAKGLEAFLNAVRRNPSLQETLRSPGTDPVAVAASLGFSITHADLRGHWASLGSSLTDEELEQAAGGGPTAEQLLPPSSEDSRCPHPGEP